MKLYSIILALLAFAFFLRVLGQLLVSILEMDWLPPMTEWYSGVIPYPILLPIQLLILVVQTLISRDLWRHRGFFAITWPRVGAAICWFSVAYFIAMVIRYVITMNLYPERRWFTGTIPILFHWILAAYLFILGHFYKHGEPVSPPTERTSLAE